MVVTAGYGLAIITAGIIAMAGDSVQVVGNAMTTEMVGAAGQTVPGQTTPATTGALTMARTHLAAALTDPATGLVALLVGALIGGLALMLVAGWIMRVATLVILAGLAPLALACYALPATQPAADLWWRSLFGCLATAGLQAVTFTTGIQLLLDPHANLPVLLGLPGSDLVNLLLVLVLLWMTVKVPSLVRRFVTAPNRPTFGGVILRAVAVQSVTRRLLRRPWERLST
jgi:hypothetical protein